MSSIVLHDIIKVKVVNKHVCFREYFKSFQSGTKLKHKQYTQ